MILMDAGPMIALISVKDQHHRSCVATLRRVKDRLVTTWPAVTEAMYLLGAAGGPRAQDLLWEMLLNGTPSILPLEIDDIDRMRKLMLKYQDRPMDLADAALVCLAERHGIRRIFTTDRKDFAVYRAGSRKLDVLP